MVRKLCVGLLVGLLSCVSTDAQAGWGSWGGSAGYGGSAGSGGSVGGGGSWGGSGGSWGGHAGGSWGSSIGGGSGGWASSGGSSGGWRPGPLARLAQHIRAKHAARRHASWGSSGGGSWGSSHGSSGGSSWGGRGSSGGGSSWGGHSYSNYGSNGSGSSGGGGSVGSHISHDHGVISDGVPMESYEGEVSPAPAQGSSMRSEPMELPSEARNDRGILTVSVPADAKVIVNGMVTTSTGESRRYVSQGLKPGKSYRYVVEATVERDGQPTTETKTATLTAGSVASLDFAFDAVETSLTLNVPADAKVLLSGNATQSNGTVRRFATRRLAQGEKWGDYLVQVTVERDGRTMTQEKAITVAGGDQQELNFDFDDTKLADAR